VNEINKNGSTIRARVAYADNVTKTTFELPGDVGAGRYAVWVRAILDDGGPIVRSLWSTRFEFEADAPVRGVPQLLDPMRPTFDKHPEFTWTAIAEAESYDVVIRLNGGFWRQVTGLTTTAWIPDVDVPSGDIEVHVRARFANKETGERSDFSPAFKVNGQAQILNVTGNGVGQPIGFDWIPVAGATKHNVWARFGNDGEVCGVCERFLRHSRASRTRTLLTAATCCNSP